MIEVLIAVIKQKVDVKIILNDKESNKSKTEKLAQKGAAIRHIVGRGESSSMHEKTMAVDGRIHVTGSYNYTYTGSVYNYESITVSKDSVKIWIERFNTLWNKDSCKFLRLCGFINPSRDCEDMINNMASITQVSLINNNSSIH